MIFSRRHYLAAVMAIGLPAALAFSPATGHARETSKACHQKFVAARTAGTLNGQTYKAFKAAQCDDTAATPAAAAPAEAAKPPVAATAAAAPAAPAAAKVAPVATNATLPSAVSAKYAKESAGKARLHTCLDQYNANKATNANGGLRWIERGGGYYSVCNTHLKG
ncbi:hypothetical protein [Novacetimonas pomaceti]|uniref:Uncharacterized protein n=1 Tax=Novacetimonas pomaceti TaxID=2021998 RepID=A0A318QAV2_9PROT|nr:hypothetical protein [Novacetimonas pomaceti]PYD75730.1 hypothetical protein CFR71_08025 [Novacetimonas pomaceti]